MDRQNRVGVRSANFAHRLAHTADVSAAMPAKDDGYVDDDILSRASSLASGSRQGSEYGGGSARQQTRPAQEAPSPQRGERA